MSVLRWKKNYDKTYGVIFVMLRSAGHRDDGDDDDQEDDDDDANDDDNATYDKHDIMVMAAMLKITMLALPTMVMTIMMTTTVTIVMMLIRITT